MSLAAGLLTAVGATPALADGLPGPITPLMAPAFSLAALDAVPDLRLRTLSAPAAAAPAILSDPNAKLRPGFGGGALDYFPFAKDGFFVSMATRLTARPNWRAHADTNSALLMRLQRDFGSRLSKRVTPAATLGFAKMIGESMTLGVESGMMLGRASGMVGSFGGSHYRLGSDDRDKMNQVTRVAFSFKF